MLHLEPDALETISGMIRNMGMELKSTRPGNNLYCLSVFLQIVVILCRLYSATEQSEPVPFRIGEAVEYMNANYRRKISIESMAKKSCMSRRPLWSTRLQRKDAAPTPAGWHADYTISRLLLHQESVFFFGVEKQEFLPGGKTVFSNDREGKFMHDARLNLGYSGADKMRRIKL